MDIRTTSYITEEVPNKLVDALISNGFGVSPIWTELSRKYIKWIYEGTYKSGDGYGPEDAIGNLLTCTEDKTKKYSITLNIYSRKNNSGKLEEFAKEYNPK